MQGRTLHNIGRHAECACTTVTWVCMWALRQNCLPGPCQRSNRQTAGAVKQHRALASVCFCQPSHTQRVPSVSHTLPTLYLRFQLKRGVYNYLCASPSQDALRGEYFFIKLNVCGVKCGVRTTTKRRIGVWHWMVCPWLVTATSGGSHRYPTTGNEMHAWDT